jgi:hypothetical protein
MKIMMLIFLGMLSNANADITFNKPQKGQAQISESLQKVLSKWDADFKVFPLKSFPPTVIGLFRDAKDELPMAVAGDFNGDKLVDYALMGHNKTHQKIVILLKHETGYLPVLVNTETFKDPATSFLDTEDTGREKGLSTYLSLLPAKNIELGKKTSFKNKPDALQIENYGGVTNAYYVKSADKNKVEVKEYKGMINE